jgi:UDP-N-acetylmuramate dehydrogenase
MMTIEENVPLAPLTSLKLGGPARYFATAHSLNDLREALLFARDKSLPYALLGGGTNLLVSDGGYHGVVIRLEMEGFEAAENRLSVEAGVELNDLVQRTADLGLAGIEPLAGIPGLVGGAVRGNAGAYGGSIGNVVEEVVVLRGDTLELVTFGREECGFRYRNSVFKADNRLIVVSTVLALSAHDREEVRNRIDVTLAKRAAKNLHCERSVGSFFMNPVVGDPELIELFESEQQVSCREGRIPAGWLIDRAGLRNTRVGAAMVSALHANYLVNSGEASAEEMIQLASLVKNRVLEAMGVQLQEEVSLLGFTPLQPAAGGPAPAPVP